MATIVHYLIRGGSGRYYDDSEIQMLQDVYQRVCAYLKIDITDSSRATLANVIIDAAETTADPDTMLIWTLGLFRGDAKWNTSGLGP